MAGLLPYIGLCVLLAITPGLDTAVVIRTSLQGGTRAGVFTAMGCASGMLVHAAVVALGMAELVLRFPMVYEIMKLLGALLLIVLGCRTAWLALRIRGATPEGPWEMTHPGRPLARRGAPYTQGLLTNLTNPKVTLFFIATLPQFLPVGRPSVAVPIAVALATITLTCSLSWLTVTAITVNRARRLLNSARARRTQELLLGAALVALGVCLATQQV
ncbi:LysE family translocator [Gandjariella thermophila]|uniref:Lysine transporter LysE n=1 Tax=Gandjariella thermophila TaxID=1931992 RepID=A0A4D4JEA0_9PSEU|nr:LysE family translocator [Gandjariella thermophila]GDY32679.1 lysine transporter LysE [Gandjariella thermophila]